MEALGCCPTAPGPLFLCPVKCLAIYMERTADQSSGRLFQRQSGGTITIDGISQQILYFIKEADTESVPKAHDVRAIATSVNYCHLWTSRPSQSIQGGSLLGS